MHDVIIIGSGPAGYTAALYASRANLDTLVFEGIDRGGQLMITSEVENYPGFPKGIHGPELMELFREQAGRFGTTLKSSLVNEVSFKNSNPFKVYAEDKWWEAKTAIIATGATARFLDIPSEAKFKGKGVSACATCDGFFFKEKDVLVVGGGDSAMEEALFLTKFASKVTILHRRDVFRASKIMFERAKSHEKIEIMSHKTIQEIYGDEGTGMVKGAKVLDTRTSEVTDMVTQGIFVAVGHVPNTSLFRDQITLEKNGYIKTKPDKTATNIPGVFAAGDVQDSYYRQAVTAAGSGCAAAIEAERYLESL